MRSRIFNQLDSTSVALNINNTDISQNFAVCDCSVVQLLEMVVKVGKLIHELISSGNSLKFLRNNVFNCESGQIEIKSREASADGDLI